MQRYVRWYREGYPSSTGVCFEIGNARRAALHRFEESGDPYPGSEAPNTAGTGSIMRLASVPLFFFDDPAAAIRYGGESSRTTQCGA